MVRGNTIWLVVMQQVWALLAVTFVACHREEIETLPGGGAVANDSTSIDTGEIYSVVEEWGRRYATAEATEVRSSQTVIVDLNDDGQLDLVALYRFGGLGTGYHMRLARFRRDGDGYQFLGSVDGGYSGAWIIENVVVLGDAVACTGRVWREQDPNCCPSSDTSITFRIPDMIDSDEVLEVAVGHDLAKQVVTTVEDVQ